MSELISEGNMGLIRAVDKFDEEKDVKFISYAVWWIKQGILEAIKKKNAISFVDINKNDTNDKFIERNVSDEEDEKINNPSEKRFSNEADERNRELFNDQKEVIGKLLNSLGNREREIIEHYYGINGKMELTLYEIGKKYDLSSERVRQVKLKAIRKLRSSMMMYENMEELLS
jgi:RNA polymerase primary sigma factor